MKKFLPEIDISSQLGNLDWPIFILVLVLTFSSVIFGSRFQSSTDANNKASLGVLDHLVMGRQLTLPLFVATLVATWYGGIFGVTKIAFNQGIYNFVTQGLFWYIAYLIFAFFMVDKITPYKAVTLPNLLEKMFGKKSGILGGFFNFFNVLPISYVISIGLFIQLLFNYPLEKSMLIGIVLVLSYSTFGGLRSVVYSDLIQFFVMCIGVGLVLILSFSEFGGIDFLKSSLPKSYFQLNGTNSLATTFIWGFIALSTLVDPNFYQRCFAAKSPKVAKKGIIISTIIWAIFDLCTTFGAMYAKSVIPETQASTAYLTYAIQLLPNGLRGFFLAAILATILSTLDSYLFLAGATVGHDLVPKKHRGKKRFVVMGTLSCSAIAYFLAIYFNGDIKTVWKTLGSYSTACLLVPVLLGHLLKRKISDNQFVLTCIFGVISTTWWRSFQRQGIWVNVDELYIGSLTTIIFYFIFHTSSQKRGIKNHD
jgi:solute:Na+ symporter, SSS family